MLTESVGSTIRPLSIIAHKFAIFVGVARDNFDDALTMSCSVLEVSEIDVSLGNVLEAEPIFLALTWEVSLPVSKVKNAAEVPDNVLISWKLVVDPIFELTNYDLILHPFQIDSEG